MNHTLVLGVLVMAEYTPVLVIILLLLIIKVLFIDLIVMFDRVLGDIKTVVFLFSIPVLNGL